MNKKKALLVGIIVVALIPVASFLDFVDRRNEQRVLYLAEEPSIQPEGDMKTRFELNKPLYVQWAESLKRADREVNIEQKLIKTSYISLEVESYQKAFY